MLINKCKGELQFELSSNLNLHFLQESLLRQLSTTALLSNYRFFQHDDLCGRL